jgi:hypothetical protein
MSKNNTNLKDLLIEYVGTNNANVEKEEVTIENIIETLAIEFPEFLLPVAEENFIRGYQQAMNDVQIGEEIMNEEKNKTTANG